MTATVSKLLRRLTEREVMTGMKKSVREKIADALL